MSAERGTEGVEIDRAPEVVPLGDPGEREVTPEDAQESRRGDECPFVGVEPRPDGPALPGGFPGAAEALVERGPDGGDEIGPEREVGPAAALLGGGGEPDEGRRPVEEEVADLQRPQFPEA